MDQLLTRARKGMPSIVDEQAVTVAATAVVAASAIQAQVSAKASLSQAIATKVESSKEQRCLKLRSCWRYLPSHPFENGVPTNETRLSPCR